MEITVWRDAPSAAASSACDIPLGALLPDLIPHDVKVPLLHWLCQASFTCPRTLVAGGAWLILALPGPVTPGQHQVSVGVVERPEPTHPAVLQHPPRACVVGHRGRDDPVEVQAVAVGGLVEGP